MKMLAQNNKMTTAVLFAAAVGLAACGKVETRAVEAADAPVVQVAFAEEGGDKILPVLVERRHFAIYNTYRVLFDDSASVMKSREYAREEGLQHAVDSDVATCSIHGRMLED